MKKSILLPIIITLIIFFFNNQIAGFYFSYKLTNWLDRKITYDKFYVDYPDTLIINDLKIKNSNLSQDKYIFIANKLSINFDIKTIIFSDLVVINNLLIYKPQFFLLITEKKDNKISNSKIYVDNIGVANKINQDLPDKIWPKKKRDVNFLIKETRLINPSATIRISYPKLKTQINLSNMNFKKIGNEKGFQHYKEVLKFIFFDVINRVSDPKLKNIIKKAYNLKF